MEKLQNIYLLKLEETRYSEEQTACKRDRETLKTLKWVIKYIIIV